MSINLKDIPDAVRDYLNNKVIVTMSAITPANGTIISSNEEFTFKVVATNATAVNGGVRLKNVRYRISVVNPGIAQLKVPSGGQSFDLASPPNLLPVGSFVGEFVFHPISTVLDQPGDTEAAALTTNTLGVGDIDTLALRGRAGSGAAGGNTTIKARVLADLDMDALFLKNEDTPVKEQSLTVQN